MKSAKQHALKDIQAELAREGKCFIAFRNKLNPVIQSLTDRHINAQKKRSYCGLAHSIPQKPKATLVATCLFAKSGIPDCTIYPQSETALRHKHTHSL